MNDHSPTTDLVDYARDLFAPVDEEMNSLCRAAVEFGMPAGWEISPDVGRLFQLLCRAIGARKVLEFGTLAGGSALWFARALPEDGRVVSIEMDPGYAEFARSRLKLTGAGYKVEVRVSAALDALPALTAE
ncbi:MAG TPA: class I SAM-dependent methyltransferase, partial [Chthonomonadales bacterium]|nr:class I SAM-dependent methyltransferase [Chthonomonadales bacterium]